MATLRGVAVTARLRPQCSVRHASRFARRGPEAAVAATAADVATSESKPSAETAAGSDSAPSRGPQDDGCHWFRDRRRGRPGRDAPAAPLKEVVRLPLAEAALLDEVLTTEDYAAAYLADQAQWRTAAAADVSRQAATFTFLWRAANGSRRVDMLHEELTARALRFLSLLPAGDGQGGAPLWLDDSSAASVLGLTAAVQLKAADSVAGHTALQHSVRRLAALQEQLPRLLLDPSAVTLAAAEAWVLRRLQSGANEAAVVCHVAVPLGRLQPDSEEASAAVRLACRLCREEAAVSAALHALVSEGSGSTSPAGLTPGQLLQLLRRQPLAPHFLAVVAAFRRRFCEATEASDAETDTAADEAASVNAAAAASFLRHAPEMWADLQAAAVVAVQGAIQPGGEGAPQALEQRPLTPGLTGEALLTEVQALLALPLPRPKPRIVSGLLHFVLTEPAWAAAVGQTCSSSVEPAAQALTAPLIAAFMETAATTNTVALGEVATALCNAAEERRPFPQRREHRDVDLFGHCPRWAATNRREIAAAVRSQGPPVAPERLQRVGFGQLDAAATALLDAAASHGARPNVAGALLVPLARLVGHLQQAAATAAEAEAATDLEREVARLAALHTDLPGTPTVGEWGALVRHLGPYSSDLYSRARHAVWAAEPDECLRVARVVRSVTRAGHGNRSLLTAALGHVPQGFSELLSAGGGIAIRGPEALVALSMLCDAVPATFAAQRRGLAARTIRRLTQPVRDALAGRSGGPDLLGAAAKALASPPPRRPHDQFVEDVTVSWLMALALLAGSVGAAANAAPRGTASPLLETGASVVAVLQGALGVEDHRRLFDGVVLHSISLEHLLGLVAVARDQEALRPVADAAQAAVERQCAVDPWAQCPDDLRAALGLSSGHPSGTAPAVAGAVKRYLAVMDEAQWTPGGLRLLDRTMALRPPLLAETEARALAPSVTAYWQRCTTAEEAGNAVAVLRRLDSDAARRLVLHHPQGPWPRACDATVSAGSVLRLLAATADLGVSGPEALAPRCAALARAVLAPPTARELQATRDRIAREERRLWETEGALSQTQQGKLRQALFVAEHGTRRNCSVDLVLRVLGARPPRALATALLPTVLEQRGMGPASAVRLVEVYAAAAPELLVHVARLFAKQRSATLRHHVRFLVAADCVQLPWPLLRPSCGYAKALLREELRCGTTAVPARTVVALLCLRHFPSPMLKGLAYRRLVRLDSSGVGPEEALAVLALPADQLDTIRAHAQRLHSGPAHDAQPPLGAASAPEAGSTVEQAVEGAAADVDADEDDAFDVFDEESLDHDGTDHDGTEQSPPVHRNGFHHAPEEELEVEEAEGADDGDQGRGALETTEDWGEELADTPTELPDLRTMTTHIVREALLAVTDAPCLEATGAAESAVDPLALVTRALSIPALRADPSVGAVLADACLHLATPFNCDTIAPAVWGAPGAKLPPLPAAHSAALLQLLAETPAAALPPSLVRAAVDGTAELASHPAVAEARQRLLRHALAAVDRGTGADVAWLCAAVASGPLAGAVPWEHLLGRAFDVAPAATTAELLVFCDTLGQLPRGAPGARALAARCAQLILNDTPAPVEAALEEQAAVEEVDEHLSVEEAEDEGVVATAVERLVTVADAVARHCDPASAATMLRPLAVPLARSAAAAPHPTSFGRMVRCPALRPVAVECAAQSDTAAWVRLLSGLRAEGDEEAASAVAKGPAAR